MSDKDIQDIATLLQEKQLGLKHADAAAKAHQLIELYKMLIRRPPNV